VRHATSITFECGPDADRHVLTKQYIFNSDLGSKEGARVANSVGSLVDRCN